MKGASKYWVMGCVMTSVLAGCTTLAPTPKHQLAAQVSLVSSEGIGKKIGSVYFDDSDKGLIVTPALTKLAAGEHGFHIHEKGACDAAEKDGKMVAALAAGGHFNPNNAPHHGTPLTGHLGDLLVLRVGADGRAFTPVLAPRLKVADIKGLAIVVHAGGDNYSDEPAALGGGGARVACGVIPSDA